VGCDGLARIVDFGIAKAASRIFVTLDASVKGKVAYMPPEQITMDKLDRRADLYAAGVVLWETIAGRRLITPGRSTRW
jgi:serine/threonine-protein kinase